MNILVTSGGTRVPIDRVRHIGNMSNGTFGSRIALQLLRLNEADKATKQLDDIHAPDVPSMRSLTFFHARYSKTPFTIPVNVFLPLNEQILRLKSLHHERMMMSTSVDYVEIEYGNFHEYANGLRDLAPKNDVIVLAAAVSDYIPKNYVDAKIRSKNSLNIELEPAPKLISEIKGLNPSCMIVGFKLLVDSTDDELVHAARESAVKNDCDFVVANDLRDIQRGKHRVLLVDKDGLFLATEPKEDAQPHELANIVATNILKRLP